MFMVIICIFSQDLNAQSTMKPFSDLIWKNRIIVVFADDFDEAYYKNQIEVLKVDTIDLKERYLIVLGVSKALVKAEYGSSSNTYDAKAIRDYYEISDGVNSTILIGKDSGEKKRWSTLVERNNIFGLIDAMPMRKSEMRKNKKIIYPLK